MAPSDGPFETHLREAIAFNRGRAEAYEALSRGASRRVSRALILSESLLLPYAQWLDRKAAPYHAAGVPLLDKLFVDMPPPRPVQRRRAFLLPAAYRSLQPATVRRHVLAAFEKEGYRGADVVLEGCLSRLARHPEVDAMMRHLLESLRRLCRLVPHATTAARRRGLDSPEWILGALFYGHLWALTLAARIDGWARPLQQAGIPIVCDDVPSIPPDLA